MKPSVKFLFLFLDEMCAAATCLWTHNFNVLGHICWQGSCKVTCPLTFPQHTQSPANPFPPPHYHHHPDHPGIDPADATLLKVSAVTRCFWSDHPPEMEIKISKAEQANITPSSERLGMLSLLHCASQILLKLASVGSRGSCLLK